ncbi:glutamate--tRNA ligase family protein (plasmid) [Paraburkholderia strydomiana]
MFLRWRSVIRQGVDIRPLPGLLRVRRDFLHLGGVYTAFISSSIARQAGGIFLLRIEDTDKLREVPNAVALLASTLQKFGLAWAEGEMVDGCEIGNYGPYRQSLRKASYHGYARDLMRRGLAYPCFATRDELDAISESQRQSGVNPGYYGRWATWRDRAESDVDDALDSGADYIIRFRSHGDENARISFRTCYEDHCNCLRIIRTLCCSRQMDCRRTISRMLSTII